MSAFFRHLATTILEPGAGVQPRLPGRFEPARWEGTPPAFEGVELTEPSPVSPHVDRASVGAPAPQRREASVASADAPHSLRRLEPQAVEDRPPADSATLPSPRLRTTDGSTAAAAADLTPAAPYVSSQIASVQIPPAPVQPVRAPSGPVPPTDWPQAELAPDVPLLRQQPHRPDIVERQPGDGVPAVPHTAADRAQWRSWHDEEAQPHHQPASLPSAERQPSARSVEPHFAPAAGAGELSPALRSEAAPPALVSRFALPADASAAPTPARGEPPTIRVHIGRIEIRAVTPSPAPISQRPPPVRRTPGLSLDRYLQRRNGGAP